MAIHSVLAASTTTSQRPTPLLPIADQSWSAPYKHFGKLPEVNSFLYYRECRKWLSDINVKTFQKDMLECLKKRIAITDEKKFEEKIPYELRFYAYFTKQKKNQYQIINEFWNNKMEG